MSDRAHVHDHDSGEGLLPFGAARDRALSLVEPLRAKTLPLHEAHGCVTVTDVPSPIDLPSFPSSAMDGFAIRSEDVAGAAPDRPVSLAIVGRVRMGRRPDASVGPAEAVAIPTGGPVPQGADSVMPVEACGVEGERLLVLQPSSPGKHLRPAGEDVRAGQVLVREGRRLQAPELGLLAAAGIAEVEVRPPPTVLVLSTGDELVPPGEPAPYGAVHDANAFTLFGQIREAGAVPRSGGIVADDPTALRDAVVNVNGVDVVISSGGVSVGERDPVKAAFGGEVEFLEVAMQPGKPQAMGTLGGRPYFGLPGNPVSVFVSFEMLIRPALMKMMGRPLDRPQVDAVLETDVTGPRGKTQFARVTLRREGSRWFASSTGGRQSNLLATVARADGLAVVPVGVETLHAGETCPVIRFREVGA